MVPWWWIIIAVFGSGIVGFLLGAICRFSGEREEAEVKNLNRKHSVHYSGGALDSLPVSGSSPSASGREN